MSSDPLPDVFECLRFLWQGVDAAIFRHDSIDECWESRWWWIGEFDVSLTDQQKKEYAEDRKKTREHVVNLEMSQAVIGQSLIIALDKIIKSVAHTIANSNVGPTVPPHSFPLSKSQADPQADPQYWANSVRVAANYVRHGREWKIEQMKLATERGADPVVADFGQPRVRDNLESLCRILATDVSGVLKYDISYRLAERLGLTDHKVTQTNFFAWKQAAGF